MLITDADTLGMLHSLGGETFVHDAGEFVAIFDAPFELVAGEIQTEQAPPTLTARTMDVQAIPRNATIRRGLETYRLARQEPDGTGMSRLTLKKA
jgi:hypothetical protein